MKSNLQQIDKSWTLFLDRDGVINQRPMNDYVKKWEAFHFLPGVKEAVQLFSKYFGKIIVVTNQQGIGKNMMTEEGLKTIHNKMLAEVEKEGGYINAIFHCPDLVTKPENCRKPGLKMAERAKTKFPDIDFEKSIMAGDTNSDMEFGRNAGMTTILIGNSEKDINKELVDRQFESLLQFALAISANV